MLLAFNKNGLCMRKTPFIVLFYACCVLFGGIFGYIRSSSCASLISGLTFGPLLLLCSFLMFKKKALGYWMALILSILLEGVFTWRFAKSLHFLPAGLLSFITLAVIIILAFKIRQRSR